MRKLYVMTPLILKTAPQVKTPVLRPPLAWHPPNCFTQWQLPYPWIACIVGKQHPVSGAGYGHGTALRRRLTAIFLAYILGGVRESVLPLTTQFLASFL